jgi:hypothetical protein
MKEYLAALLPRLQQFSKSLNDTALLAEHPWVFLDGDGRRITHIFRRGGELLVADRRGRCHSHANSGIGYDCVFSGNTGISGACMDYTGWGITHHGAYIQ